MMEITTNSSIRANAPRSRRVDVDEEAYMAASKKET
jgi:hypothetical protein